MRYLYHFDIKISTNNLLVIVGRLTRLGYYKVRLSNENKPKTYLDDY